MNLTASRPMVDRPLKILQKKSIHPAGVYSAIIVFALIAFEAINYSTTAFALRDLLGNLKFAGIHWSTLLALAFCSLDFAGFARLVTQKGHNREEKGAWYLFAAWLIAAAFNAALTWWGVTIAIANHAQRSAEIVTMRSLTTLVPVMVAIMVWLIRVLIIGSLTSALEKKAGESSASSRSVSSTRSSPESRPTSSYSRGSINVPDTGHPVQARSYPPTMAHPVGSSNPSVHPQTPFNSSGSRSTQQH